MHCPAQRWSSHVVAATSAVAVATAGYITHRNAANIHIYHSYAYQHQITWREVKMIIYSTLYVVRLLRLGMRLLSYDCSSSTIHCSIPTLFDPPVMVWPARKGYATSTECWYAYGYCWFTSVCPSVYQHRQSAGLGVMEAYFVAPSCDIQLLYLMECHL